MTHLLVQVAWWLAAAPAALAAALAAHEAAHLLTARVLGLAAHMRAGARRTARCPPFAWPLPLMGDWLAGLALPIGLQPLPGSERCPWQLAAAPHRLFCPSLLSPDRTGPAAILRVLDPRPPGYQASCWYHLPHVTVAAEGCTADARAGAGTSRAAALWWTRHAGWLASAALAAAACWAHATWAAATPPGLAVALHAACCASLLVLACALPTDLCGRAASGAGTPGIHAFFCGNLGLLLASMTAAAEAGIDPLEVLERQCTISMMRGAQSGGLVTLVSKGKRSGGAGGLAAAPWLQVAGVRRRVAPSKRQSLAVLLDRQFRRATGPRAQHPGGYGLFVGAWAA